MTQSDRDSFGFLFVTLARRWRRALDHELATSGLSDASWSPLIHLSLSGDGVSQTELAARAGLDTSSLVRLLDRLEQRGLVERRVDPTDRRARRIHLTPQANAEIARIRNGLAAIEAEMLADLTDADMAAIVTTFARIAARIDGLQSTGDGAA